MPFPSIKPSGEKLDENLPAGRQLVKLAHCRGYGIDTGKTHEFDVWFMQSGPDAADHAAIYGVKAAFTGRVREKRRRYQSELCKESMPAFNHS